MSATALTLETRCATTCRHLKARPRAVSSVGRASRLHREGRRFESVTAYQQNQILMVKLEVKRKPEIPLEQHSGQQTPGVLPAFGTMGLGSVTIL
jgi:hypothetical protein